MSKEMDTLFPDREIEIGGETLKVSPFKFGQFPQVIKKLKSVGHIMDNEDFGSVASMIELASEGGDDMLDLIAMGLRKDREWVDELDFDDGVKAISIIIESNHDFFISRVLPIVSATMERLSKKQGKSQSKKR